MVVLAIAFPQKIVAVWGGDGWKDLDRIELIGESWENKRRLFQNQAMLGGPSLLSRISFGFVRIAFAMTSSFVRTSSGSSSMSY